MEASTPRQMVIRRTTPQGDRRRRVVLDDSVAARKGTTVKPERTQPPRRYSSAAQRDAQPHLFECIPTRRWSLLIWFLLGNTIAVVPATLHVLCDQVSHWGWAFDLSPLRINGEPNVFRASQTLTFLLCTLYCGLTVQFRRHRIDDYRGRYRIWYSATVLSALLSFHAASNIASLPWQLLVSTSSRLGLAGQGWPAALICLITLPLLVRLLIEIWACRAAVSVLLGSFLGFCFSQTIPWLLPQDPKVQLLATGFSQLISSQWLLFALVLNTRHVFLDAQGELPTVRRLTVKRTRKAKASAGEATAELAQQVDRESETKVASYTENAAKPASSGSAAPSVKATPHEAKTPSSPTSSVPKRETPLPASPAHVTDQDEDDDEDEDTATLSMSRAERKRQRKDHQKSRRAA